MRPARPPAPLTARALAPLLALVAATGCATSKKSVDEVRWPLPPETARVKFVRAFSRESDMKTTAVRSAMRVFVPAGPDEIVAQPTGLALSPDERYLYVACASVGRVLRADLADGKLEVVAKTEGRRPASPFAVAVDGDGNLYVSDMAQNTVWVYAPGGDFLRKFATDKLEKPTGIAIDRRRQLLYAVTGVSVKSKQHRVEVFSLQGKHLRTIGTRGTGPGEFNFPTNLTVATDGRLFVVDMLNFRVQVFDPEGQVVGMFGTIGAGQPGTLDKAKSVALDAFGNVYVVDSQQGWVQIFNPKFQSLMAFGGRARLAGYMQLPTAITISSKNNIYVADFAAGVVNEYLLVNTSAADSFAPEPEAGSKPDPAKPIPGGTPPTPAPSGG